MDLFFNEEQRALKEALRRYALERLLPDFSTWDRGSAFPRERVRELGELGIFGIRVRPEYGGTGSSFVSLGIASEELSRGDFNVSLLLQMATIAAELIGGHSSESLQARWLPRIAAGDAVVAFALTEPGAGSDAAAIRTSALRDGDVYVLSGEKASISLAGLADASIVFARTGGTGARGIGAFLVPLDLPGVSRQIYASAGERMSQRGSLFFDDVRVPADGLIGSESRGFVQAMESFDYNRAVIALACLGAAAQSLDETIEYAKQRHTFGQPLARREGVSFQIAEHATLVRAARALAYETLALRDRGESHTKQAAMAKWLGPKVSVDAIHACMLLHGWSGYGRDLPFEQRLRDVMGLEVGDGTPEIMKGVIAREIFGRQYASYR